MTEIIRINTRTESGKHQVVHPETNAKAVLLHDNETLEDYVKRIEERVHQIEKLLYDKNNDKE